MIRVASNLKRYFQFSGFVALGLCLGPNAFAYLSASPSFVSFPDTPVNTGGYSRSVTVRNNSNETVENINIYDNCFSDFQVSNYGCYGRLGPYSSCSLNVQFRPYNEGYRNCTINISASGSYESVSVSGRGVKRLSVGEEETISGIETTQDADDQDVGPEEM